MKLPHTQYVLTISRKVQMGGRANLAAGIVATEAIVYATLMIKLPC